MFCLHNPSGLHCLNCDCPKLSLTLSSTDQWTDLISGCIIGSPASLRGLWLSCLAQKHSIFNCRAGHVFFDVCPKNLSLKKKKKNKYERLYVSVKSNWLNLVLYLMTLFKYFYSFLIIILSLFWKVHFRN